MKNIIWLLGVLTLTSCSTTGLYRGLASGQTGCAEEDIKVTDENSGGMSSVMTWTAECKGKKYRCSANRTALGGIGAQANCKEAQ